MTGNAGTKDVVSPGYQSDDAARIHMAPKPNSNDDLYMGITYSPFATACIHGCNIISLAIN
jgi:hypothetical protein